MLGTWGAEGAEALAGVGTCAKLRGGLSATGLGRERRRPAPRALEGQHSRGGLGARAWEGCGQWKLLFVNEEKFPCLEWKVTLVLSIV